MSYYYGATSLNRLATCDKRLQAIFMEVIKIVDCSILCGVRNKHEQDRAYMGGRTKVVFPLSKHNEYPSEAIDVIPYPVDWLDLKRMYMFVGIVKAVAFGLNIPIRCGADWDGDFYTKDQAFNDLPHFELL